MATKRREIRENDGLEAQDLKGEGVLLGQAAQVDGPAAPSPAVAPEFVLDAEQHRVIVRGVCEPDRKFRARGVFRGGPGAVTTDWSEYGGGALVIPCFAGVEVEVGVQYAERDGTRSAWQRVGSVTTPRTMNRGLSQPPKA